MNKYLAKGVATALLITTVAGGMMLAPINQDAEAATKNNLKLCSHTNISTSVTSTNFSSTKTNSTHLKITVNSKRFSSYKHVHKHESVYESGSKFESNFCDINTLKNKKQYRNSISGDYYKDKYSYKSDLYVKSTKDDILHHFKWWFQLRTTLMV